MDVASWKRLLSTDLVCRLADICQLSTDRKPNPGICPGLVGRYRRMVACGCGSGSLHLSSNPGSRFFYQVFLH